MRVLLLEPFLGGSHARFVREIQEHLPFDFEVLSLPGRHWKWHMRFAAPVFADRLREMPGSFDVVLASTFLNLAELAGLAPPAIARLPRLLYWHENQLAYPERDPRERDLHFGVTNLVSALAADRNVFNSEFNRRSFLEGVEDLFHRAPGAIVTDAARRIRDSSAVVPVPLDLEAEPPCRDPRPPGPPIVLWNHRWEHDKNPEAFFDAVEVLAAEGLDFRLAVVGETFRRRPECFDAARERFADRIEAWGFVEGRDAYLDLLRRCRVVVSTARHEFQGLAVLEAVAQGAAPVLPRRLSYPELFPDDALYDRPEDLVNLLRRRIETPPSLPPRSPAEDLSWAVLGPIYEAELRSLASGAGNS